MSKYLAEQPVIADFENKGYLVIRVTDEVVKAIATVFETAAVFFRSDKAEKSQNSIPALHEGWYDVGGEFSITPDRPDLHEAFWVTQRAMEAVKPIYTPLGLDFNNKMQHCINMYNDIERSVTKMLMEYLGIPKAKGPAFECNNNSDMQVLYYQPHLYERDLLQDPHDDGLYMTFAKGTHPGLEIQLADGAFHKPSLKADELIVMPGTILSLMTGYRVKPLIHRIMRHANQTERFSLVYFTLPNMKEGEVIAPWVLNDTNRNVDIMARIIENESQFLTEKVAEQQTAG
ncbi:MAG TPA: 2OG-Fe(II) oxygenase family protein [Ferruginibacter sp.]|nr:2OG-Fe(II) oxygenase family protein [Ferruginibacter sp.]HMP20414.1 2OG-Fe(II) oxygenase family protein [Ferruginibacter sp.]